MSNLVKHFIPTQTQTFQLLFSFFQESQAFRAANVFASVTTSKRGRHHSEERFHLFPENGNLLEYTKSNQFIDNLCALPRVLNAWVCVFIRSEYSCPHVYRREEANNFANLLGMWLFAYHLLRVCVCIVSYCKFKMTIFSYFFCYLQNKRTPLWRNTKINNKLGRHKHRPEGQSIITTIK